MNGKAEDLKQKASVWAKNTDANRDIVAKYFHVVCSHLSNYAINCEQKNHKLTKVLKETLSSKSHADSTSVAKLGYTLLTYNDHRDICAWTFKHGAKLQMMELAAKFLKNRLVTKANLQNMQNAVHSNVIPLVMKPGLSPAAHIGLWVAILAFIWLIPQSFWTAIYAGLNQILPIAQILGANAAQYFFTRLVVTAVPAIIDISLTVHRNNIQHKLETNVPKFKKMG